MATGSEVVHGDVSLHAGFLHPVYGLFSEFPSLAENLLRALGPHGLTLADVKHTDGDGVLGDVETTCFMFRYAVVLRVLLDRVEVNASDTSRIERQVIEAVAVDSLACLGDYAKTPFGTYAVNLGTHTRLAKGTVAECLAPFAGRELDGLGAAKSRGFAFYYGPQGIELASSVIVEPSSMVENGLFVRIRVTWDGSKTTLSDLPRLVKEREAAVYSALALSSS